MYQCDWAVSGAWEGPVADAPRPDAPIARSDVLQTALLLWTEHCVECAAPACYSTCSLYVPRGDRHCARFVYGIYPNPQFGGLFDYGADIRFRRWGKLLTHFYGRPLGTSAHRRLDRWSRAISKASTRVGAAVGGPGPRRDLWNGFRKRLLRQAATRPFAGEYDEFLLECFAPDSEPCRLVLEYLEPETERGAAEPRVRLRRAFDLAPGWNRHAVPADEFRATANRARGSLRITLDNDAERRLVFTWLDFVKYAVDRAQAAPAGADARPSGGEAPRPAERVKCVAWDLDNTLWRGTLVEDGEAALVARPEALDLVRQLDERGILQTALSKNNHDDAWRVVTRLGLQDYFLYPGINWGRKSENLRQIAQRLNINLDTFAVIDDAPFERAEISAALPQVRVYSDRQIGELLAMPPFDAPITVASRSRRQTYLENMERERVQADFGGDYDEFLRQCQMRLRVFTPRREDEIARALEILQRTNQLNLSGRRYAEAELREALADAQRQGIGLECRDRFGSYGIVGFAMLDEREDEPTLVDFCLSCRVAQKKVEHAFLRWLALRVGQRGAPRLLARLLRTPRNGPLLEVFRELPFETLRAEGDSSLLAMPIAQAADLPTVVELVDDVESDSEMAGRPR